MLFRALYEYLLITVCAFVCTAPVEIQNSLSYVGCRDLIVYQAPTPVFVAPVICAVPPKVAASLPEPALIGVMLEGKRMWTYPWYFHSPSLLIDIYDMTSNLAHLHIDQDRPLTLIDILLPFLSALYTPSIVGVWFVVMVWISYTFSPSASRISSQSTSSPSLHPSSTSTEPILVTAQVESSVKIHIIISLVRFNRIQRLETITRCVVVVMNSRLLHSLLRSLLHSPTHHDDARMRYRLHTFTRLLLRDCHLPASPSTNNRQLVLYCPPIILSGPDYLLPRYFTYQNCRLITRLRLYHRAGCILFEGSCAIDEGTANLLKWHHVADGFHPRRHRFRTLFDCWVRITQHYNVFTMDICLHTLNTKPIDLFTKLTGKAAKKWRGKCHRKTPEYKANKKVYDRNRKYKKRAEARALAAEDGAELESDDELESADELEAAELEAVEQEFAELEADELESSEP